MSRKRFDPHAAHGFGLDVEISPVGMAGEFTMSPFSVLDARQAEWQNRKRAWTSIGLDSELGRGKNLLKMSGASIGVASSTEVKNAYEAVGRAKKSGNADLLYKNQNRLNQIMAQRGLPMRKDKSGQPLTQTPKGLTFGAVPNYDSSKRGVVTGTSIFDPVLCELAYQWFCPKGGTILDPFSGGSVRGIVAALCDHQYTGVDLRQEQIDANNHQWETISQRPYVTGKPMPRWITGDSMNVRQLAGGEQYDFLFSCPPYGNLEVYSQEKGDISNMSHEDFITMYRHIIKRSCSLLKPNRFAAFVIGDFRCKNSGELRGFVSDTERAFRDAGMSYYNECILVTMVGSLPIRSGAVMRKSRKIGKSHQNMLVFFKGDTSKVAEIIEKEF